MLVPVPPGFLYTLAKDFLGYVRGRRRRLTTAQLVAKREEMRQEIEEKLRENKRRAFDVIVHDVKRIDEYPDLDEKNKGISAWFRCGLIDTYHRGILLGLSGIGLKYDERKQLRYVNYKNSEQPDINLMLTGYVPYENIEAINWDGDKIYNKPHIYCYFDHKKGQPYEKMAFCEERELNKMPYYTEIAAYEPIFKRSKKLGIV
jgi:hypothetical protein